MKLNYVESNYTKDRNKINQRKLNIWFNLPYKSNVQNNVSRTFLNLIHKHWTFSNTLLATWLISFLRSLSICFLDGNYYQSIIIITSLITNLLEITIPSFLVTRSTTDQLWEWRHGRQTSNRSFPHPGWVILFFSFSFFLSLFLFIFLLISLSL